MIARLRFTYNKIDAFSIIVSYTEGKRTMILYVVCMALRDGSLLWHLEEMSLPKDRLKICGYKDITTFSH